MGKCAPAAPNISWAEIRVPNYAIAVAIATAIRSNRAPCNFKTGRLRAYIQNRDLHYHFHLDLESRVYTARRVNEYGSGLKPKGKPPPTFRPDRACAHGND